MRDDITVGRFLLVGIGKFYVDDKVKVVDVIGRSHIGKLSHISDESILVTDDGWGISLKYRNIKRINHVRLGS
jgi:hypothetical protein